MNKNLQEVVEFADLIEKLKKVKRAGWVQKLQTDNVESVADHTFGTTFLAMVLSDLKRKNVEKIVRMALLHDLEEAIIGDLSPHDKAKISKKDLKKIKAQGKKKLIDSFPKKLRQKYAKILKEHDDYVTKESKLLNEIDNLEMIFQALNYEKEGFDKEKLNEFWNWIPEVVKPKDKDVIKIFELLKKEREKFQIKL